LANKYNLKSDRFLLKIFILILKRIPFKESRMDLERIFSAEQIKLHPILPKILKDYTKAVIKANPENIVEFSYNYFKDKVDDTERKYQETIAREEEADERALEQMDN
jgi:hypothetical protein